MLDLRRERSLLPALTGLALTVMGAGPAQAQTVAQDSAIGSGYRVLAPQSPDPSVLTGFSIDARSGPEGEDPVGSVMISPSGLGPSAPVNSGPVTCLRVIGNRAIIGWARTTYVLGMPIGQESVGAVSYAEDNGTPGADLDRLQVERDYSPTPPTVCPTEFPPSAPCPVGSFGDFENLCNISSGELTVRDASDTDPPKTKITKSAPNRTEKTKFKFKFKSSEPESTFECKLDKKKWKPCDSPLKVKGLDEGKHKFKVRAIDAAGNVDSSPAKDKFKVVG